MWRKVKWLVLVVIISIFCFAFSKPAEKYFDIAKSLDIFATLFKEVNAYYVDEVDPQKLVHTGIKGMLESLDPYTDFIPEEDMEIFRISTTGQYGGIGALIGIVNKKVVITHPYRDFPAYRAGIKVGDELISVDGKNIKGDPSIDVSLLLKGQPKTEVEVKVRHYGEKGDVTFTIRREKISINNIAYFGVLEPGIGYIKLDDFTSGASREMQEAVFKLKEQSVTKLIIDLRDNPGGLLQEAVNITNLFIPKGQEVVSTRGKVEEWNTTYRTLNAPQDTEIPIVILTSEGSASASEIVAGSLQDYDRAVLIGERTFGKGLVQTTRSLGYNAQLKVTTAKYYIPSGRCIQELDYSHRKDDGTVNKVADSLRTEFKTKHGRKVFDGGGLDPDLFIEDNYFGTVTVALISAGFVFEYASKYCSENPNKPDLKSFRFSDKEYEKFVAWIKDHRFSYVTPVEKDADELIKAAKQEKFYKDLADQLNNLKIKIASDKDLGLIRFKNEIIEVLEQQIAFHYSLTEGQAEVSLGKDKTVLEARKLLNNLNEYKKILSIN